MADIQGTNGNDTLNGTAGDDTINGLAGNDMINGGDGNDVINGGPGEDNIRGGAGDDTVTVTEGGEFVFGEAGRDTLIVNYGSVASTQFSSSSIDVDLDGMSGRLISAAGGNQTIYSGIEDIRFIGGTGGDSVSVTLLSISVFNYALNLDGGTGQINTLSLRFSSLSRAVTLEVANGAITSNLGQFANFTQFAIYSGNGNDRIVLPQTLPDTSPFLSGLDYIQAGDGDDYVEAGASSDAIYGERGNDTLYGGDGDDTIVGGINGAPGPDVDFIDAGAGNDTVEIGFGDTAIGGSGTDTITINLNTDTGVDLDLTVLGNGGTLSNGSGTISGFERYGSIVLGGGNDRLVLGNFPSVGGPGFGNAIIAGAGNDYVSGSPTNDLIDGGAGSDTLLGLAGDDRLNGADGNDILEGGSGADNLQGETGDDELRGGDGNDVLQGGAGTNLLVGGAGDDRFVSEFGTDTIIEAANEGTDTAVVSRSIYLLDNIENIELRSNSATNAASDYFGVGNASNNVITAGFDQNLLLGGGGNDVVDGGAGNDAIFGESGDDDLIGGFGIDYLVGGIGNDRLRGGDQADALYGEDGDDILESGISFDTDILVGGRGNDTLYGNSGFNTTAGQGDYDLLYGNEGNDTFYVDTPADLVFEQPGEGVDTVYANIRGAGYYLYENIENLILLDQTPFGVGNALNNSLTGAAIGNYLLGGAGDDILNGKQGGDVLFGETGADTFVFERGTGGDVVGDFTRGQDRIDIRAFGLSFAQVQANFIQNGNVGAINLGNGDFIVLHNVTMTQLTAADFIL